MSYKSKNVQCGFFVPYLRRYKEVKRNYSPEDEQVNAKAIQDAKKDTYDVALNVPGFAKIALNVLKDLEKTNSYLSIEDNSNYKKIIKSAKKLENPFFFKKRNRHHFELYTKQMVDNFAFTVLTSNGFGSSIIEKMKESEELGDLSDKLEDSLNKKIENVNELVDAYSPIIEELAERYSKNSDLLESDLLQEGNLAAMRSAGKFDYKKGKRFIAYVPMEIISYMSIAVEKNRQIQLPREMHQYISKLKRYSLKLFRFGKKETFEQKAEKIGVPEKRWIDVVANYNDSPYLEERVSDESDLDWNEFLSDEKFPSPFEMTVFKDLWIKTYEKLLAFPQKFSDVLRFRFGITDKESSPHIEVDDQLVIYDDFRTLEETGGIYQRTREAIRQRQDKAIDMLRELEFIKDLFKKSDSSNSP